KILRDALEVFDGFRSRHVRSGTSDYRHSITECGDARDSAADAATSDHREFLAVEVLPGRNIPVVAYHAVQRRREPSGRRGDQEQRVFCNRLVENAWRVGAKKTCRSCSCSIDAVVAYAEARDDAAGGQRVVERSREPAAADD